MSAYDGTHGSLVAFGRGENATRGEEQGGRLGEALLMACGDKDAKLAVCFVNGEHVNDALFHSKGSILSDKHSEPSFR